MDNRPTVAAAIAVFNGRENLRECLLSGNSVWTYAVVLDDGSTDGTDEMLQNEFPEVIRVVGDGNFWWTKGTNHAIKKCLETGCDYVLLVNPDIIFARNCVDTLIYATKENPGSILASLVLNNEKRGEVWWGGSKWGRLAKYIPIYTSRYIYRSRTLVSSIPVKSYISSEAHGRAVLVPAKVFRDIGLYDEDTFPHYGADIDFSFRAIKAGYQIKIIRDAQVYLKTHNSGMVTTDKNIIRKLINYKNFMTRRKNGEFLRVWWRLLKRHVPLYALLPSYIFSVSLNTYRFITKK